MPSHKGLLASPRLLRKTVLAWISGRRRVEPGHTAHKIRQSILQPRNKDPCITQSQCKLTEYMVCSLWPYTSLHCSKVTLGKEALGKRTHNGDRNGTGKNHKLPFPPSPEGGSRSPAGKAWGALVCFEVKLLHQDKRARYGRGILSPVFCFGQFFPKIHGSLNPIQHNSPSKESLTCVHFPPRSFFFPART